jgi:hypothetical protein
MCIFSLVPVFGMFMLCTKMLGLAPMIGFQHHDIFPETDWSEFFLNTKVTSHCVQIKRSFFFCYKLEFQEIQEMYYLFLILN